MHLASQDTRLDGSRKNYFCGAVTGVLFGSVLLMGTYARGQAPSITVQPQSTAVLPGPNITFSVTASGANPLRYQWRKDGSSLTQRTNASLTISNAQPADTAAYSVVVSNAVGSVTSVPAYLRVTDPATAYTTPFRPGQLAEGLVGWWKLDEVSGQRADSSGRGNHLADNNGVGSVPEDYWGSGERSADFESTDSEYLSITDAAQAGLGLTSTYSFCAWVRIESINDYMPIAGKTVGVNGYSFLVRTSGDLGVSHGGGVATFATGLTAGKWQHVAVVYDDANDRMACYVNGNLVGVATVTANPPASSDFFGLGKHNADAIHFDGLMKDAAVWSRALAPAEVKSIAMGLDLQSLTYRPGNVSVPPTAWWKLNELSGGDGPVSRLDSVGVQHLTDNGLVGSGSGYAEGAGAKSGLISQYLSGPTGPNYAFGTGDFSISHWIRFATIAPQPCWLGIGKIQNPAEGISFTLFQNQLYLYFEDIGQQKIWNWVPSTNTWYHLVLRRSGTNLTAFVDGVSLGSLPSTENIVNTQGIFIGRDAVQDVHPFDGTAQDVAIWKGYALSDAEIKALATGLPVQRSGAVSYWPLNETNGTRFDAIGSNHLASSNSVVSAPGLVGQAANFTRSSSQFLSISDMAQSGLDLTNGLSVFVWVKPASTGIESSPLSKNALIGAGGPGYAIKQRADRLNGLHVEDTTSVGTLLVTTGRWIMLGGTFDGGGKRSYFDGTLHGVNSSTYAPVDNALPFVLGADNFTSGFYDGLIDEAFVARRVLRDDEIKAIYNRGLNGQTAFLLLPPTITMQPQSQTVAAGTNVILGIQASGDAPLSYQWRFNGALIAGVTNATITVTNFQLANAGNYIVVVSNALGSVTSIVATLTIPTLQITQLGRGTITVAPSNSTYAPGQSVTLTATPARYYTFLRWLDGNTNNPRGITITASNNYYAAVFTNATGGELEELVFPQWEKVFGGNNDDRCTIVRRTADGGFILGGFSLSATNAVKTNEAAGAAGTDCWVVKTDSAGLKQWDREFGGTGADYVTDIILTSDGGYLLVCASASDGGTGNKTSNLYGVEDFWLIKLSAQGNKEFERDFGGAGGDAPGSGAQTADGGFILTGVSDSPAVPLPASTKTAPNRGQRDLWMFKLDADANFVQDWTFGSSENDSGAAVVAAQDGGYFLAGGFSLSLQNRQLWTVKTDSRGSNEWNFTFGDGANANYPNAAYAARQTIDQGYAVLGVTPNTTGNGKTAQRYGDFDWWLLRLDANGGKLWDQSYGGSGSDFLGGSPGGLQITPDGSFILAGSSTSAFTGNKQTTNYGNFDGWVVKTDSAGNKKWEFNLGGTNEDAFTAVEVLPDGYLLAGYTASPGGNGTRTAPGYGGQDFWLVKLAAREAPVGTPVVLVNGQLANDRTNVFNTQSPVAITLTSTWNGPIHFTLDGSEPDFNSPQYSPGNPPPVVPPATVKAIAYLDDNYFASELYVDYSEVVATRLDHVPLYALSISTPGGGTVAANPAGSPYTSNSVVTISATNLPGWTFLGWQGGVTGTNPVESVTLRSNFTAQAIFGTALTTNATTGGSIARVPVLPLYSYGSPVRLMALPAASRYLAFWTGALSGAISPQELTITNANPVVGASFGNLVGTNFGLTVQITGEGTVSYTPATNRLGSNALVMLTATPKSGWTFANWSGGSNSVANPLALIMHTNKAVTASFTSAIPPLVITQPTNQTASPGESLLLTVTAVGTGPLNYQWRLNGTNLATEQVLFSEDFESRVTTNLLGQGGWINDPFLSETANSLILVTNGFFLPTLVMNGRMPVSLNRQHVAQHAVAPDFAAINTLRFTAYASSSGTATHNQAVYFLANTNRSRAVIVWSTSSTPTPRWHFGVTSSQGEFTTIVVPGGFDQPARLGVVVDAVANEVHGTYDFGAGMMETARISMPRSNLLTLDSLQLYVDHRGESTGGRGMELDDLTLTRKPAGLFLISGRMTGIQSAQLTITNFQPADVGNYSVVVSSPFGSVTSVVAVVSLNLASNTPPVVTLTNPPNGTIFIAPASVALAATASDSNGVVASVSFQANGALLGAVTAAPYQFTWTNAPLGAHTLTAVATDNGGLSTTSAVVLITVSNQPPVVQLTQPANGAVFVGPTNLALAASAADTGGSVTRVRYFQDGTNLIAQSTSGPGYNAVWSNAPLGTFALTAEALDNDGATTVSAPHTITINPLSSGQPVFRIALGQYGVREANTNLLITVEKIQGGAGTVNYLTAGGSAAEGQDFGGVAGAMSFSATQQTAVISIPIYDDFLPEELESFLISLSAPSTNTLIATPGSATITITNEDTGLSFLSHTPPGPPPAVLASLTASLSPTNAAGQWRLPDAAEPFWRDGGVLAEFLEPGNYDIEFLPRAGWHAEPSAFFERIVSSPPALTVVTSVYLPGEISAPGWLTVTLEPPEYASLTRWRRQGEAAWHPGGDTIQGLPPGEYVIEFLDLATNGLETPFPRAVTVSAGFGAEVAAHYKLAAPGAGAGLVEKTLATVRNNSLNFGYGFNGQLRTALGYGSGTAVRDRVVLTAAHVLFNETNFAFASEVWWYFQRHKGEFEPHPLQPSGLIVFSNYVAARATNAPPEVLEPLDVAALYFTDPAPKPARGGSSGYLASDAANNEWLSFADRAKFIAGYPMTAPVAADHRGRLFTSPNDSTAAFQPRAPGVFRTFGFTGLPGMSGGGLYVFESGTARHYPAAVYLGGNSDSSIVRAIDSSVVGLLDAASRAALGDTNHYSAGLLAVSLINSSGNNRIVRVEVGPPSAVALGAGWRSTTMRVDVFSANTSPVATTATNVLIEFKPVPGFLTPPSTNAPTVPGQTTRVQATYVAESPRLFFSSTGLRVSGPTGAAFALEFKSALSDTNWTALSTHTLTGGVATLPQIRPTNTIQSRFYQLRWLTNF